MLLGNFCYSHAFRVSSKENFDGLAEIIFLENNKHWCIPRHLNVRSDSETKYQNQNRFWILRWMCWSIKSWFTLYKCSWYERKYRMTFKRIYWKNAHGNGRTGGAGGAVRSLVRMVVVRDRMTLEMCLNFHHFVNLIWPSIQQDVILTNPWSIKRFLLLIILLTKPKLFIFIP